ncbi:hypothetical protein SAMN04489718_0061 [Actinopolyspora saharensis]|uniref:Uncharacterized protein n=1 Tax=Actinopolyspora saharensis TaxID=995062 RepID=A0A1H0XWA2_9ACTN|nr:hypothetical protein SAMN04489718_0061 [Actinopolyspora saharensis]
MLQADPSGFSSFWGQLAVALMLLVVVIMLWRRFLNQRNK